MGRAGLAGLAEASAVVGDYMVACVEQDWELFLPASTAQWVSIDEYDRLAGTMVLVLEINTARILTTNTNVWH